MAKKKASTKVHTKEPKDGGYNLEVVSIPKGEKKAGMWTLKINGKETLFYSSKVGIDRLLRRLTNGPIAGSVRISALQAGAKLKLGSHEASKAAAPPADVQWDQLATMEERVNAFLTRGKLSTAQNKE